MKPTRLTARDIMFSEGMDGAYDLNIGLILGDGRNYVVDTGLGSGSVAPVLAYIGSAGRAKPTVVINTHWHWDHLWGNWSFSDALIAAHTKCHELADRFWDEDVKTHARYIDGEARKCLPNCMFEDGIYFPDDGIRVFYSPGHTIDSVSVYDERDRVLYAGDNIGDTADAIIPNIETDAVTYAETVAAYGRLGFSICVSGHNKPWGADIVPLILAAL